MKTPSLHLEQSNDWIKLSEYAVLIHPDIKPYLENNSDVKASESGYRIKKDSPTHTLLLLKDAWRVPPIPSGGAGILGVRNPKLIRVK
jgi:hypothetical protein